MMKTDRKIGLYVHVPFCLHKCAYCDFYSGYFYDRADAYLDAVLKEAAYYRAHYPEVLVDTVYFGGGTPSSLSYEQLDKLLCGIFSVFKPENGAEITLEANPATLDESKLSVLKRYGVNRLSIGMQSALDSELAVLSRIHTFSDFVNTYKLAKNYIPNISIDLMYGLPEQTLESFQHSIREAVKLAPEHISMYALKIEEGTPFCRMGSALSLPSDDTVADMYLYACDYLQAHQYLQYEISNFAKHNSSSKHNLRYWQGKEYLGLGPSAHSYMGGVRYSNHADLSKYSEALSKGSLPDYHDYYRLDQDDLLEEAIILPLRLTSGLDIEKLSLTFGYQLLPKALPYIKQGFMTLQGSVLSFTTKGFLVSNTILSDLLPS